MASKTNQEWIRAAKDVEAKDRQNATERNSTKHKAVCSQIKSEY